MQAIKIIVIVLGVYVGVVALFESLIGYFQPASAHTVTITTFDADGSSHDRVLSGLESGGQFYVAVNHWPRAWYRRLLDNPAVRITRGEQTEDHLAVKVSGAEASRVESEHPRGLVGSLLMGFAPRYFIRLDPVAD